MNEWPIDEVLYHISVILSSLHLSIVLEVWNWNAGEECAVLVFPSGSVLGCFASPGLYSHSTIAEREQDKLQVLDQILSLSGCTATERHVLAEEEMRASCKVWCVGEVLELSLPVAENDHEVAGLLCNKFIISAVLREVNKHFKTLLLASVFSNGAKHSPGEKKI